jgi:hypothetical protein
MYRTRSMMEMRRDKLSRETWGEEPAWSVLYVEVKVKRVKLSVNFY